jgi:hypothetical protein
VHSDKDATDPSRAASPAAIALPILASNHPTHVPAGSGPLVAVLQEHSAREADDRAAEERRQHNASSALATWKPISRLRLAWRGPSVAIRRCTITVRPPLQTFIVGASACTNW